MLPLIKWTGGKRDEIKHFAHLIPEFQTYVEPFAGGAALFFHLEPERGVIADVHPDLIALYRTIAEGHADQIRKFMENHPNDEATYYQVRGSSPTTDLEKACKFYYERKTCYRGMLRYNKKGEFNIPFGRYKSISWTELDDPRYTDLMKRTTVLQASFETIFETYNDPGCFIFLDPPYDSEFTDYGYCNFGKEHHRRLAECFKKTRSRCLMVIGRTPFIEELYTGYIHGSFGKKYAFKLHSGRVGDEINTDHLIIMNYSPGGA